MAKFNNQDRFQFLRTKYPNFFYSGYSYALCENTLKLEFEFKIGDSLVFKPHSELIFPQIPHFQDTLFPIIDNIVFNIGMIELISYWKATCSPNVFITTGFLEAEQINFWKDLYYNGLGEFFYLNTIQTDSFSLMNIHASGKEYKKEELTSLRNEYIVPIGGGKDSAVTIELLATNGLLVHPLIMNPREATLDTVSIAGLNHDQVLIINRTIDPLLIELNSKNFLNGHTPFSAMLAFYTILASVVSNVKHIALSNEASANESTIPGTNINHQYSKSFHFESAFRNYYQKYISSEPNYFSFLRPLNELKIMQLFSGLTKYHNAFRSCNSGSKTNTWCGHCPKCLFTHIMLAAFRGVEYSNKIIGKSMLDDESNARYFDELTGISEIKPFECVGTIEDVQSAMHMILKNNAPDSLPKLAKRYLEKIPLNRTFESNNTDINNHFLNKEQYNILEKALEKNEI